MIKRAAIGAGLELKAHPHMLRHARGYAPLTKATTPGDPRVARSSLDHEQAIYTALTPIQGFWRD